MMSPTISQTKAKPDCIKIISGFIKSDFSLINLNKNGKTNGFLWAIIAKYFFFVPCRLTFKKELSNF